MEITGMDSSTSNTCQHFINWAKRSSRENSAVFCLPTEIDGIHYIYGYYYAYEGGGCFVEECFKLIFNKEVNDIEHFYRSYGTLGKPGEYHSDTANMDYDLTDEERTIPVPDLEIFKIVENDVIRWLYHVDEELVKGNDESIDVVPEKVPSMKLTSKGIRSSSSGLSDAILALVVDCTSSLTTYIDENDDETFADAKKRMFYSARIELEKNK